MGPSKILENGLVVGMNEVGKRFKLGSMFVPEVLRSARTMHAGQELLRPLLAEAGADLGGRFVLGTVQGDLHDIGKNLVGMMCEGAGFEVIDLGFNLEPGKLHRGDKDPSTLDCRHVRSADHHHAGNGPHDQSHGRGRSAG